ncbi:MAG: His-Xaa-Ser system radical SAM maturase HxsB [Candidatus Omnitrophota bacterium]|jgi:His-Xaa-Ser system radical SAM maturase HxsB|nr:MAG: His-Xaa-Ser system radical SAM maturase HxsB [Candidatus Omnitrophota bacterium]
MSLANCQVDEKKVHNLLFKPFKSGFLITNSFGNYHFLNREEFASFVQGDTSVLAKEKIDGLREQGFLRDSLDFSALTKKYLSRKSFLFQGPSLHIMVVTHRCNHKCLYCQTNSKPATESLSDMQKQVSDKVIDFIFESPNKNIAIEFQGGEPLLNFDTIKHAVSYAKKKNEIAGRNLLIVLVTNMSRMDKDKLKYLLENNIGICTSLDGPEALHNKYRLFGQGNSYNEAVKWIKVVHEEINSGRYHGYKHRLEALTTVTRDSLLQPKEIIDTYLDNGFKGIDLRPVQPFGVAEGQAWQGISFTAEEFMGFYKSALDYIIKLNSEGKFFYERRALIFLTKILTDTDPNFLDLRSPCGAGIGQMAYDTNGDIYTCDEGRMFAALNPADFSFRLGNVSQDPYSSIMKSSKIEAMCLASCLDNLPHCSSCVYKPYCGVCPLYNYAEQKDLFMKYRNQRCSINEQILDYLFSLLRKKANMAIFKNWIEGFHYKQGEVGV